MNGSFLGTSAVVIIDDKPILFDHIYIIKKVHIHCS